MDSNYTLGYHSIRKNVSHNEVLTRLDTKDFVRFVEKIPICQYKKGDSSYDMFKSSYIPSLFFCNKFKRPMKDDASISPTGFACLDIDNDSRRYLTKHPSVWAINYTGGGTHIIVHGVFGESRQMWQRNYLDVAYEVLEDLHSRYEDKILLDWRSSDILQGCLIWNTGEGSWVFNDNFNYSFRAAGKGSYDNKDIDSMFSNFHWIKDTKSKNIGAELKERVGDAVDSDGIANRLGENAGIRKDMRDDLFRMSRSEWLGKWLKEYKPVFESSCNYKTFLNYKGELVSMAYLKGEHATLWRPKYFKTDSLIMRGERGFRLVSHLIQLARIMQEDYGKTDQNQMLLNAVYFISNFCEDGINESSFKTWEILTAVTTAIEHYTDEDESYQLYRRKQRYRTAEGFIDYSTGEFIKYSRGEKISLNASQRKTERILITVANWNPDQSPEQNHSRITRKIELLSNIKLNTMLEYIKTAKSMSVITDESYEGVETKKLTEIYGWLEKFKTKDNRGKKSKMIKIKDKVKGKTYKFSSHKECMEFLECSEKTLFKFLKGDSKLNKKFDIIDCETKS